MCFFAPDPFLQTVSTAALWIVPACALAPAVCTSDSSNRRWFSLFAQCLPLFSKCFFAPDLFLLTVSLPASEAPQVCTQCKTCTRLDRLAVGGNNVPFLPLSPTFSRSVPFLHISAFSRSASFHPISSFSRSASFHLISSFSRSVPFLPVSSFSRSAISFLPHSSFPRSASPLGPLCVVFESVYRLVPRCGLEVNASRMGNLSCGRQYSCSSLYASSHTHDTDARVLLTFRVRAPPYERTDARTHRSCFVGARNKHTALRARHSTPTVHPRTHLCTRATALADTYARALTGGVPRDLAEGPGARIRVYGPPGSTTTLIRKHTYSLNTYAAIHTQTQTHARPRRRRYKRPDIEGSRARNITHVPTRASAFPHTRQTYANTGKHARTHTPTDGAPGCGLLCGAGQVRLHVPHHHHHAHHNQLLRLHQGEDLLLPVCVPSCSCSCLSLCAIAADSVSALFPFV